MGSGLVGSDWEDRPPACGSRYLANLIHDIGPEDSGTTGAQDRMIIRPAWTRDEKPEYYGHSHIAERSTLGVWRWHLPDVLAQRH